MVKLSEVKARCTICGDTLKIVNKGTTTLANHLKTRKTGHGLTRRSWEAGQSGGPKQQSLEATFARSFTQERFEELVVKLIVASQSSFTLVDYPEFKELVHCLNANAKVFGANPLLDSPRYLVSRQI